jgi:hypothetical protein
MSVIVGRSVAVNGGVFEAGRGVTPGSSVAVGPSVFVANGSRVAVEVGKLVALDGGVFVGPAVAGVRKERSSGMAEHPLMSIARTMSTIFFSLILCMSSSEFSLGLLYQLYPV